MRISRVCAVTGTLLLFTVSTLTGEQEGGRLADPFSSGWMLTDSNGDGVLDFVAEKVVVPAEPSAAENAVAADIAARLGFATTGLTPPVVVSSAEDRAGGPRIWVGVKAVPAQYATEARRFADQLAADEGGCSNWAAILPCSAAVMPGCWPRQRRSPRVRRTSGKFPATGWARLRMPRMQPRALKA